jgi:ketosteroid isomerase-like protein
MDHTELLQKAYAAFNSRDIDQALSLLHTEADWPNGWEGGYVHGHDEVRAYWTRQWEAINPHVEPVQFTPLPDGRIQVSVHQVVKDKQDNLIVDEMVNHIYTIEDGLVRTMQIENP